MVGLKAHHRPSTSAPLSTVAILARDQLNETRMHFQKLTARGEFQKRDSSGLSACAICHTGQSMGLEITDEAALTAWLTDDLAPLCVALDNP